MANETARMAVPFPAEFEDPWYATFASMMEALDGHEFAGFEDRLQFVLGGGSFSWDVTTSTLTWAGILVINTPSTGNAQALAAGSIVLANGDMWTVDVTRGAADTVVLADAAAPSVDPNDSTMALAIRYGTKVYFRNGGVLDDGDSAEIFEGVSAATLPTDRIDVFAGDGATTVFALSFTKHANCIPQIYLDGILLIPTVGYTVSGTTLTMLFTPLVGEVIDARYWT